MPPDLWTFISLAGLGFVVGAYGTLVGAGGGVVLVPALLLLMPEESPATLTSISLAVVFFNAYAGTVAYARMRRIDYFAAVLFGIAGVPGAVLGTALVREVPRQVFDPVFGLLLLAGGVFLAMNPAGGRSVGRAVEPVLPEKEDDRSGRCNTRLGAVGSAYIALIASLLGIGGGVIHVPFLVRVLGLRPHVATATSHCVLTMMALTASVAHMLLGEFRSGLDRTTYLAVGVMMGAPLGAAASSRVRGSLILRLLAVSLCFVGLRLIGQAFQSRTP